MYKQNTCLFWTQKLVSRRLDLFHYCTEYGRLFYIYILYFILKIQGFQYFSSVPVLHYLQEVLCIKCGQISWIFYTTLFKISRYQRPFKGGGKKYLVPPHPILKCLKIIILNQSWVCTRGHSMIVFSHIL